MYTCIYVYIVFECMTVERNVDSVTAYNSLCPLPELRYYIAGNIKLQKSTWSRSNLPLRTSVLTPGCLFLFCSCCPIYICICLPLSYFSLLLSLRIHPDVILWLHLIERCVFIFIFLPLFCFSLIWILSFLYSSWCDSVITLCFCTI